ncbi:6-phosphogluconate dehydrogenase (decarboxylating) [Chthonomonas calidirosea]|uniref:6-phosphogluconate dehydrogenase (Decarboxylating) n=1 Tax=Chthonomonas calidirosea (strain DSM 23976 / ICMP 18418 / T49) TaxID=1303518 RepID=S0EYV6_CHTCT|nr:decarboxylating 6-phosphogluconate dehydrogenase [Chthonomonas calidirosea]CCW35234.1 6-phosphogluconate dehydrogenase (decarboxylating) [Chthonomonas calidirosea T49]CEK19905.1 6-phosphogluconate dehydrogenase (decarboxylating) [Chthonomonas calidirosea]CEK19907.1 6-phosphogluconate dehydrogenase (decarboxylating) [Chthonomonas calidirosea]CEK20748.1 6-phosphogluconate dehydrogenase (decarboxylating) [Chthonomonas calidirosea]
MEMGIVGLGKMGGNMAERLIRRGHRIVGSDPNEAARQRLSALQGVAVSNVKDLIDRLEQTPKVVWSMVPAGEITDNVITEAAQHLRPGDIVIDGGNSRYTDSQRHYAFLKEKGIRFLDAGTSGGIWGLQEGYCLMVGGDPDTFQAVEPLLRDLAPEGGLLHTGPAGSGHYVKMVHNGIEYALMQAYAEGFEILKASPYPNLDLEAICNLWQHGSVVRSWLLELAARAFHQDPNLEKIEGYVEDSGEGRWTVMESIEHAVPAPVIALSLYMRFRSRQPDSFSAKVLAALRNQFGGHPVHLADKHD